MNDLFLLVNSNFLRIQMPEFEVKYIYAHE